MRDDCSLELVAIATTIQLFTGSFGQPAVGDKNSDLWRKAGVVNLTNGLFD